MTREFLEGRVTHLAYCRHGVQGSDLWRAEALGWIFLCQHSAYACIVEWLCPREPVLWSRP